MAIRTLGVPCPGGIAAAMAWVLGKACENEHDVPKRVSELLRFPKQSRATCPCGCHDYTGEASRCPNCEEPLFR
ncbi:MAG: hypothetical protein WC445_03170 [Patescibacteria group bacterium]